VAGQRCAEVMLVLMLEIIIEIIEIERGNPKPSALHDILRRQNGDKDERRSEWREVERGRAEWLERYGATGLKPSGSELRNHVTHQLLEFLRLECLIDLSTYNKDLLGWICVVANKKSNY
jgi:hypothetical protein